MFVLSANEYEIGQSGQNFSRTLYVYRSMDVHSLLSTLRSVV